MPRVADRCENGAVTSDYRLAPALAARLTGAAFVLLALVVFTLTLLGALLGWPLLVVVVAALLGLVAVGIAAWRVQRVVPFHADEQGYRVRFLRGAGAGEARWTDVEDVVTSFVGDEPVVVLRLRDGRTTTVPVRTLAVDREQFVRDLQDHLQRAHGRPPIKRRRRR